MNFFALSYLRHPASWIALFSLIVSTSALAQPTFTKVFDPGSPAAGTGRDAIGPGSTTTLRFDIDNTGSASQVSDIGFTDVLPTAIVLADPASPFTDCADGVVSAPDGGTTISLSGARLGAGEACSVTVNVTSSVLGMHLNTSGALTSSAGSSGMATATLFVDAGTVGFSKSFAPGSITLGGTSVLTLTYDNTANTADLFILNFNDALPAGMVVAVPANASTDCIGTSAFSTTTLTAVSGTNLIEFRAFGVNFPPTLVDPVLLAGATCTVSVDVTTTSTGVFVNTVGLPTGALNENDGFATAALDVPREFLNKSFTDDPVAPDGLVTLDFTVTNLDRTSSATDISFDDPLPAGLTFDSLLSDDCGGVLDTATASLLKYSGGGSLAPGAACTLSVRLQVPAAASTGTFTNTTTAFMATIGGNGVTGNTATDILVISTAPVLTKEFLDAMTMAADPVVNAGDDLIVRFTITNTSTTSSATDVAFEDIFDSVLATASVTPGNGCCGDGSICTFTPLLNIAGGGFPANIAISGGSLAPAGMAGDSCTFSLTLDVGVDAEAGIYPNTTSDVSATVDGATQAGDPGSDDFTIISAPSLSKAFTDDPVQPGGTVTLEFTLTHSSDAPGDATGITFTDDLTFLTGLTANLPPTPDPPCGVGSTLTGSAGDTLLTLAGGSLIPGGSCTFSVTLNVPVGTAPGNRTNTTSGVGATVGGLATTSAPASDDLGVFGLTFTKEFIGDPVIAGGTVTLQFTLDNTSLTEDATSIFFGDNLEAVLTGLAPSGMLPATPCGPSSTLTFSGTTLSLAGAELAAGDMCMYSVTLLVPMGSPDGIYPNATTLNFALIGTTSVFLPPATDELTVASTLLALSKAFTDDPVTPGGTVTLEFTLTNLDAGQAASAIDFSDDLGAALSGLTFDNVLFNDCGATITGTGTTTITVVGASLVAGGTCTIQSSLILPGGAAANFYTNTTSAVTGMIGGTAVSGTAASDDLQVVDLLLFTKSFDAPSTAAGTPKLTFTLTNPGSSTAIGIFFSDELDDVITGLIETNLPLFDICGFGSALTSTSSSLLTLTDGTLPPSGGMCSFDVDLLVPATATAGIFPNTTSDLFQGGLLVAEPATANLIVLDPPLFTKSFAPTVIVPNDVSTLTFSIDNSGNVADTGALDFTDNLPAGLVIASPSNATTNCTGGTITAASGTGSINYTGGTVTGGTSCTVSVNVTATGTGQFDNISGDLTSEGGNSGTASASLISTNTVSLSKAYLPRVTEAGATIDLTFTLVNPSFLLDASNINFTDDLAMALAGLNINTALPIVDVCGMGSVFDNPTGLNVELLGGNLLIGAGCMITLSVTIPGATEPGTYGSTSSIISSDMGGVPLVSPAVSADFILPIFRDGFEGF